MWKKDFGLWRREVFSLTVQKKPSLKVVVWDWQKKRGEARKRQMCTEDKKLPVTQPQGLQLSPHCKNRPAAEANHSRAQRTTAKWSRMHLYSRQWQHSNAASASDYCTHTHSWLTPYMMSADENRQCFHWKCLGYTTGRTLVCCTMSKKWKKKSGLEMIKKPGPWSQTENCNCWPLVWFIKKKKLNQEESRHPIDSQD